MKSKSLGISTLVAAAINLLVDICTIRSIGLYAASGSTLISYLLLFVFRMINVQKLVRVRVEVRHLIIVILIMIVESAFCFIQNPIFDIINIVIGVLLFVSLNIKLIKVLLLKTKTYMRTKIKHNQSSIE